jgi:uncharacterized protein (TIGR03067 family)
MAAGWNPRRGENRCGGTVGLRLKGFSMKTLPLTLTGLIALVCGTVQAGPEQELNRLRGSWEVTAIEVDGKPQPKDKLPPGFTITGNKLTGLGPEMAITIDPTKKPKWIDLTFKKGDKSYPIRAIYALEGDAFTICMPLAQVGKVFENRRPESFETKGKFVVLIKAKRKPKKE